MYICIYVYIYKENVYIVSTSLVLSFGSPILFYVIYLHIFFLTIFFQTHVWIFTKPTTVGNYIYTLLQISLRGS